MLNNFKSLFKPDIKFIARDPMLLLAFLAPFILILFLKFFFPFISDTILQKTGFLIDGYYTLAAITMISLIPMFFGMVHAFILPDEKDLHRLQVNEVKPAGKKEFLCMRMIVTAFLSFLMVLLTIVLTNPVPAEGWLRTIFVAFLLSTQSSFVILFIGSLKGKKVVGLALSMLYGIFVIAVPFGLLLHHPWNYFAFFSPLYWSACAWVCSAPPESLIYGAISMVITFVCIAIFFHHFMKRHTI